MNTPIDIETIPSQSGYPFEEFLVDSMENFKAPSDLTKGKAAEDLGMTEAKEIKFISKDEMIVRWTERFKKEKAPEVAEANWRKTSFDGGKGELITMAFTTSMTNGPIHSFKRDLDGCEATMLDKFFHQLLIEMNGRPPYFIGSYVGGFDLKFIYQRAVVLGVKPPCKIPFDGRHGKDFYDVLQGWTGYKDTVKQDELCKILGIQGKPDDIDGSKVWDFVKAGDVSRVAEYNVDDVDKVRQIYNRLEFIGMPKEINQTGTEQVN